MPVITPSSTGELAQVLAEAASQARRVSLFGKNSKRLMGGPVDPSASKSFNSRSQASSRL